MRMRTRILTVIGIVALLGGVAPVLAPPAHAGTACILKYSYSDRWEDNQNWGGACDSLDPTQRRLPRFDDDVIVNGGQFGRVLSSHVTVKSVTVETNGLSIRDGGDLIVTNGGGVTGAGLSVDGATAVFEIGGTFTLSMQSFTLTVSNGGRVDVNGELGFSNSVMSPPTLAYLTSGGTMHNYGTIAGIAGGGAITSGLINDGLVDVQGGRLEVAGAPGDVLTVAAGGTGGFNVGAAATLCFCGPRVLPPAGVTGAGRVETGVSTGNWNVGSPVIVPTGTTFSPAEFDSYGGDLRLDADASVSIARFARGTRSGTGTLTVLQRAWFGIPGYGGLLRGTGTTIIGPGAFGRFDGLLSNNNGTGYLAIDAGHTLKNYGTLQWLAADYPASIGVNGATLQNFGTMEIDNDSNAVYESTSGGIIGCCGGRLDNRGTIVRDQSSGSASLNIPTDQGGTVQVKTGTLHIGQWRSPTKGNEIIDPSATLVNDFTTFGSRTVTKTGGTMTGRRSATSQGVYAYDIVLDTDSANNTAATAEGALHVATDLTAKPGTTLRVSADPANALSGPMKVDGQATITGSTVDITVPSGYQLHDGDIIPVVHTNGPGTTLVGTFAKVTSPDVDPVQLEPRYSATDAWIVVKLAPRVVVQPTAPLGAPTVGSTLTALDPGTWEGAQPIAFTPQWERCILHFDRTVCTPIAGAATGSYTVQAADRGYRLRVVFTAVNSVGSASAAGALSPVIRVPGTTMATTGDVVVLEPDTKARAISIPITLDRPAPAAMSLTATLVAGSAQIPSDVRRHKPFTVRFGAGKTTAYVPVAVVGDRAIESTEELTLHLSNPSAGLVLAPQDSIIQILDDDSLLAPPTRVSIDDVAVTEGDQGDHVVRMTVVRSGPSGAPVSFDWSTTPLTMDSNRFIAASGHVTMPASKLVVNISVTLHSNTASDAIRQELQLDLTNVTGAAVGRGTGYVYVLDDD